MYDTNCELEQWQWVEKELKENVFINYDPSDQREISYSNLAEVLTNIKYVIDKKSLTVLNGDTVKMLRLLKKLGILQGSQINNAYQLWVTEWDEFMKEEREEETMVYFFTNEVEKMYDKLQNIDFVDKLPIAKSNYFKKFLLKPIKI